MKKIIYLIVMGTTVYLNVLYDWKEGAMVLSAGSLVCAKKSENADRGEKGNSGAGGRSSDLRVDTK